MNELTGLKLLGNRQIVPVQGAIIRVMKNYLPGEVGTLA